MKVLTLEPVNLKALYRRAAAYYGLRQLTNAIGDLDVLLTHDPVNTLAMKLKATIERELKSTQPDELDVERLKRSATQSLSQGHADQVVELLSGVIENPSSQSDFTRLLLNDQITLSHYLLTAYYTLKNFRKVLEISDVILTVDVKNFRALLKRGEARIKLFSKVCYALYHIHYYIIYIHPRYILIIMYLHCIFIYNNSIWIQLHRNNC